MHNFLFQKSHILTLNLNFFFLVCMWPLPALNQRREANMTSSCCGVPHSTPVHLISLHQQMEWIGFAQGSWFSMIKVDLKLFSGVNPQLILPATMGSVKLKHHKNITHGMLLAERIHH